jgi:dihydroorotate dehydrogenase electron transfer subunit
VEGEKALSMSNPLHAAYYADEAVHTRVEIVENVRIARNTFRLRFNQSEIARRIVPGQFLMVRIAGCDDPLIGRPLAMYDVIADAAGRPQGVDVVYLVKGKFTTHLATLKPGQTIDAWGPLGNGFVPAAASHLIIVAGGIGYTPFVALAKENLGVQSYGSAPRAIDFGKRITLCYGARSADYFAGLNDFAAAGAKVLLSTDDGTRGHRGLVTELLERVLAEDASDCRIACCGPEPMMEAVAEIAAQRNIPCQVSLETPMACGIGICFTCVAKVRDAAGEWDYKRTCVEGPVFEAAKIVWER